MSTSEKKENALATSTVRPRTRGSLATRDYSLPKPYRRKAFPEEQPSTSKMKLALWAAAGVLMAGLIAELTSLAQENLRQRRLPIIAAAPPPARPEPAPTVHSEQVQRPAARQAPYQPAPPALAPAAALAAEIVAIPAQAQLDDRQPRPGDIGGPAPTRTLAQPMAQRLPLVVKKGKLARSVAVESAVEPDPDVVLITAILLLSPHLEWDVPLPGPVCTPGAPKDPACAELQGMRP